VKTKKVLKRILAMILAVIVVVTGTLSSGLVSDVSAAATTPVAAHGKLSVSGTQLVDQYGKAFQIRGVSTHGLQWYNQYNTKATYQTLRDDWGANCIRLAMYVEEGGYMSDQSGMKKKVTDGVSYATDLGMYAIIDWHILNGNTANPKNYTSQAKTFFAEMAQKYKNNNNVIYEICNEPNNCSWSDIKSYAIEIINTIRTYDKDAIIIVGTPTYSQLGSQGHLYEPCDDPITGYSNIMYAFHFYASDSSHNQWLTQKIGTAISRGLPVFVTEFGLSEASGDGTVDTSKATEWLNRCDQYNVSYCVWSLSNDYRSSSLINSSCSKTSGWSTSDLTTAGNFIRNWYRLKNSTEQASNPTVNNIASNVVVSYSTHVQTYGWQSAVSTGGNGCTTSAISGTVGLAKRLEGIKISISGGTASLGIRYKTHVQSYGWQDWKYDGALSGTTGEAKRLEAIMIELTGADKDKYDVYYRVHAQTYGWLDWAKNGEVAGTTGLSKRLEAINIVVVPKGASTGLSTSKTFVSPTSGAVNYSTHVQSYGWQTYVSDGEVSGTVGQAKRLEGIKIQLGQNISGGIRYSTHVQKNGWQNWVANGALSGTTGEAKRLEAIKIELTGDAATQYDVYYRVHVQKYGWLDWAKNGEMAGTSGKALRLEGIQIQLVPKGGAAPGSTAKSYIIG
jgi:uncharacterized protein YjdB